MAKPLVHAKSSAKRFGGDWFSYFECHQYMDSTKSAHATLRHRAVFHCVEGANVAAVTLGPLIPGTRVPTIDVCLQHVEEDLGRVPPLSEYLDELTLGTWMLRPCECPEEHAALDAKKYGGRPDDYVPVHAFMDSVTAPGADPRAARVVLHHAFGAFVVERAMGFAIRNSADRLVHVRDLAEQHVLRELGRIPDLGDWLQHMAVRPWMAGARRVTPEKNRGTYVD